MKIVLHYAPLWLASVAVAIGCRWLLPTNHGLTFYFHRSTRYLPANVIGFWASLAAGLGSLLFLMLKGSAK